MAQQRLTEERAARDADEEAARAREHGAAARARAIADERDAALEAQRQAH